MEMLKLISCSHAFLRCRPASPLTLHVFLDHSGGFCPIFGEYRSLCGCLLWQQLIMRAAFGLCNSDSSYTNGRANKGRIRMRMRMRMHSMKFDYPHTCTHTHMAHSQSYTQRNTCRLNCQKDLECDANWIIQFEAILTHIWLDIR